MTTFDEREHAFENMFAHDAELQFKALARCNKLLGMWAAERMGLTGDAAESYARSVINEALKKSAEEKVLRKIAEDLEDKGSEVSDKKLRKLMNEMFAKARTQIIEETDH